MRERPILFNGDMVRAILEGRKTVTRRLVPAWQLPTELSREEDDKLRWMSVAQRDPRWGFGVFGRTEAECMAQYNEDGPRCCPFGNDGGRLWVREAWVADAQLDAVAPRNLSQGEPIHYPADGSMRQTGCSMITLGKTRPSIHMPRWASRILLEVTAVRVERLHDITDEQCIAEGCRGGHGSIPGYRYNATLQEHFRHVWESAGGDYFVNPWVWVIEFKRVEAAHA